MKAKLILTAMAMPVLFAACTSDELVPMDQTQQQAQRPLLSKDFYLTSELEGDEETRYAVTGTNSLNFSWTEGDMYGAAVIDQFAPGSIDNWPIIPSLSDNTPFKYDGSKWTAVADDLGVGHYMFTYKYNSKDNNRAAVSYTLPVIQEITKDDLNAFIKQENKAVAVALLKEGDKSSSITLRNLYAYPKFRIQFDNGLPVTTIYKVVLENKEGFQVAGGFNHKKVANMFDSKTIADAIGTAPGKFRNVEEYWASKQTADFLIASGEKDEEKFRDVKGAEYTVNLAEYTQTKDSKYIIAQFPEAGVSVTPDNVNNTNNKCVEVRFMLPGDMIKAAPGLGEAAVAGYDWSDFDMYVYTNDGVYELNGPLNGQIQLKDGSSEEVKDKIFARNTSYTITLKKDAFIKGADLDVVTNITEWNKLVGTYKNTAKTVVIVGDKFAFNSTTQWPNVTWDINTAVKIEGNVTPKNINVDKIIVPAGSTLTVNGLFAADEVENSGSVNFVANEDGYTAPIIGKIVNKNEVSVAADVETGFIIENGVGAELTNAGVLTLNQDAATTPTTYSTNLGTITNDNLLKVDGLNNNAEDKNSDNVFEEGVDVIGTITNNEDGVIMSIANSAVGLTNNKGALITNDGEVSCSNLNSSKIENKGTLKANGKMTYITSNKDGVIVANAAWPTNIEVTGDKGTIEYTAGADANLEFVKKVDNVDTDSYVNTLNVPGSLTIAKDKLGSTLKTINVNGTGTLTLGNSIANLNINAGTTTLGSNVSVGTLLFVEKGASVFVPADKTLTIANTSKNEGLTNNGSISVAGKLVASNMEKAASGKVNESGSKSEFTWWKDTSAQDKLTKEESDTYDAYIAAIDAAIEAYWNTTQTTNGIGSDFSAAFNNWSNIVDADLSAEVDTRFDIWNAIVNSADMQTGENVVVYSAIAPAYNEWQTAYVAKNGGTAKSVTTPMKLDDAEKVRFKDRNVVFVNGVKDVAVAAVKEAVAGLNGNSLKTTDWKTNSEIFVKIDNVKDLDDMWSDYLTHLVNNLDAGDNRTWAIDKTATKKYDKYNKNNNRLLKFGIKLAIQVPLGAATPTSPDEELLTPNAYWSVAKTSDLYKAVNAWYMNKGFKANVETTPTNLGDYDHTPYFYKNTNSVTLLNIQNWYLKASETTLSTVEAQQAKIAAKLYAETVYGWTNVYSDNQLKGLVVTIINQESY